MTIAYAMNYVDGPFCSNGPNSGYSGSNDNFQYPRYFQDFAGGYPGPSDMDAAHGRHGRRDHGPYSNGSTPGWPGYDTTPFGALGDVSTAFPGTTLSPNHAMQSPQSTFSRASSESVSRTGPPPSREAQSRAPSPQEPMSSYSDDLPLRDDTEYLPTAPSRRRGRPRLHKTSSASAEEASQLHSPRRASCVPHKQIERKYREGLNMEFERLRRAIPTLPQCTDANVIGATKPSKGMVLAAAIDYIGRIERERDAALDEIERLGGSFRTSKLNSLQADRRMI